MYTDDPKRVHSANDAPKIAPKIAIDDPKHVHDCSANDAPKIAPKIAIDNPKRVHERTTNDAPQIAPKRLPLMIPSECTFTSGAL